VLPLLFATSCGHMTGSPTAPSTASAPAITAATNIPTAQTIQGVVGPLAGGAAPCWADRYPCEVYDFTLSEPGSIEVTLTWEGQPRSLMVQLYWTGEGLAHEDVAPRTGPSRISFRRTMMEAARYRLRVVSLEPETSTSFTLRLTY
jgi:hypothetical protein